MKNGSGDGTQIDVSEVCNRHPSGQDLNGEGSKAVKQRLHAGAQCFCNSDKIDQPVAVQVTGRDTGNHWRDGNYGIRNESEFGIRQHADFAGGRTCENKVIQPVVVDIDNRQAVGRCRQRKSLCWPVLKQADTAEDLNPGANKCCITGNDKVDSIVIVEPQGIDRQRS